MLEINKVCTFFFTILLLMTLSLKAQTKKINEGGIEMQISPVDTSLNAFFCYVGQMPEFPGGKKKLIAFAKRQLKYPKTAVKDNVEGSVILQFVIDTNGKVTDKQIFKSVREDIDRVCLEMLSQMPGWKPALLGGKTVAVNESWRITFVLSD